MNSFLLYLTQLRDSLHVHALPALPQTSVLLLSTRYQSLSVLGAGAKAKLCKKKKKKSEMAKIFLTIFVTIYFLILFLRRTQKLLAKNAGFIVLIWKSSIT